MTAGNRAKLCNLSEYPLAVVAFVGDHVLGFDVFEQAVCLGTVVELASGEDESQRTAQSVGEHVDLCAQTTSGAPQSLGVWAPPFPEAAC